MYYFFCSLNVLKRLNQMTPISASDLCNQIGWFKEFPKNQGQDIKCTRRAMNLFLHCTYIKQYTDVKVFLKYRQNSLKRETQKKLFTLENARKLDKNCFLINWQDTPNWPELNMPGIKSKTIKQSVMCLNYFHIQPKHQQKSQKPLNS